MDGRAVEYGFAEGVARVTLASSADGNILTAKRVSALRTSLARAAAEPACRVLVLSGSERVFCRGLSLDALGCALDTKIGADEFRRGAAEFAECLLRLCRFGRPTLAVVRGCVQGGGVGLAAACDLVLAETSASFQLPEALVGLVPALIGPVLSRRMDAAHIRALTLSTKTLRAQEALLCGLVDEVSESDVERSARRLIRRLLRSAPEALTEAKTVFARASDEHLLEQRMAEGVERLTTWVGRTEARAGVRSARKGTLPPWWPDASAERGASVRVGAGIPHGDRSLGAG